MLASGRGTVDEPACGTEILHELRQWELDHALMDVLCIDYASFKDAHAEMNVFLNRKRGIWVKSLTTSRGWDTYSILHKPGFRIALDYRIPLRNSVRPFEI